MEHIRILLLGVSFRVYISYKSGLAKKKEKVEMAETREVRRGLIFLTDFSKNSS